MIGKRAILSSLLALSVFLGPMFSGVAFGKSDPVLEAQLASEALAKASDHLLATVKGGLT